MDPETRAHLDRFESDSRQRDSEIKAQLQILDKRLYGIQELLQVQVRIEERQVADRATLNEHGERIASLEGRVRVIEHTSVSTTTEATLRWRHQDKFAWGLIGTAVTAVIAAATLYVRYVIRTVTPGG